MVKDNKIQILVVEDDEEMRILLEKILTKEDYKIYLAKNGDEGLKKIDEIKNLNLVLSDIKMPECNGMDMLQSALKKHPDLPVILITAFGDVEQYLEAMNLGACEYLMKPFKTQDLLDIIKRVLSKDRKSVK